jgi:acetoin utilization deacetylase AcuC-like enzyme
VRRTAERADVLFYQAGVDPHVDDPLGGIMTTEQLAERDRIVYETCREMGVPVVTNLAGGYQRPVEKVVGLHVNTLPDERPQPTLEASRSRVRWVPESRMSSWSIIVHRGPGSLLVP